MTFLLLGIVALLVIAAANLACLLVDHTRAGYLAAIAVRRVLVRRPRYVRKGVAL